MAEPFHRNPGDQSTYGYRQLPGAGPAGGPELKTMVYATIGVALGIVVGTLLADGSWRSFSPFASHQLVRASSTVPGSTARPVFNAAQTTALNRQTAAQASPQLSAAQKPAASTPTPSVNAPAPAQKKTSPQLSAALAPAPVKASMPGTPAVSAVAKSLAQTPAAMKVSGAGKLASIHRHWPIRKLVGGRTFLSGRRKGHGRHRLHAHLRATILTKAAIAAKIAPPKTTSPKLVDADLPFVFMVEGNVTVANFDALAGTIDTYEGEAFSLDRTVSQNSTISWLDYPPDIHYRCDQSWKCTLIHDGVVIVNARRTR